MNFKSNLVDVPILALGLVLSLLLPTAAKQFVQCSVSVDGQKTFKVDSIYPDKKVYLEVRGLASAMGWRVMPINNGRSLRIGGQDFNDLKEYDRRTYVSADEIGQQFGYEVKDSKSGLVVDLWTKSGGKSAGAAPVKYDIRVLKKEKTTTPNPEYDMYKLTLQVKNPTTNPGSTPRAFAWSTTKDRFTTVKAPSISASLPSSRWRLSASIFPSLEWLAPGQ